MCLRFFLETLWGMYTVCLTLWLLDIPPMVQYPAWLVLTPMVVVLFILYAAWVLQQDSSKDGL